MGVVRILAVNLALLAALVLGGDFVLTQVKPLPENPDREFRIQDPVYSHTLKPMYSSDRVQWGNLRFPVRTNSLGFRDATMRVVSKQPQGKRRLVIIGDSFTEGIGLGWDETFVGRFAKAEPQLEVLDAGVLSYAPSVYYRKTAWLLDSGYAFDELLVYIDISDLQDEALAYRERADGTIEYVGYGINYWATVANPTMSDPKWNAPGTASATPAWKSWMKAHFAYSNFAYTMLKAKLHEQETPRKILRSYWTVDPNIPGYGDMGVEGALRKATAYMDRLAALMRARGIALSVGVYPWPDQLDFDTEANRGVTHWKAWCERNACARFIDHTPDFFAFKRAHADWRERLFVRGDVHHTPEGAALMAQRLIAAYGR
ncbi:MAG TPA: hypothetical protein VH301_09850 [Usitatibacter sp.]|jgi:hypothetical protein|nr:hypothetical protein [Usitatibacter sp.]